jgi:hypothetical protein
MGDSITKHEENQGDKIARSHNTSNVTGDNNFCRANVNYSSSYPNDATGLGDHYVWQRPHTEDIKSLMEKEAEEGKKGQEGKKYSEGKAPMGILLKQFRLALQAVAMRSKKGHEKYKETDQDWMNFKRVPDAIEEYTNGTARHLAYIGDDETELGHEAATAWNALARLQLILEKQNG